MQKKFEEQKFLLLARLDVVKRIDIISAVPSSLFA
ncbi:uncharacterized protein METZ01_LOCUS156046, partial [marine metagenome]